MKIAGFIPLGVRVPRPPPMYHVYVLKSKRDGHLYTGSTSDLTNRIKAHNSGKVRSTKGRRPFVLLYSEPYAAKTEALRRELFLKSSPGRKELIQILNSIKDQS